VFIFYSSATSKVTQRIKFGIIEVSISSILSLGLLLGGGWGWSSSLGSLGWGGSFSWGGNLGWGSNLSGNLSWGSDLLGWGSWGGNLGLNNWGRFLGGSLLLLQVLGEEFLISDMSLLGFDPGLLLVSLADDLSSDSLLGDESLDAWRFVESLVSNLDLSSDDVVSNIILSLSEDESLSDMVGSLWSKSSWSIGIGKAGNILISLDKDLKGDDGKIWAANASSGRFSLSLSGSSWSVECSSCKENKKFNLS
jgi:hypothetical protein